MKSKELLTTLEVARQVYPQIYLIISPPRCASTALARAFWEQESVRYYSHEPFETTYYEGASLAAAEQKILEPIDLSQVYSSEEKKGRSLVIKEMPYQVGEAFPYLLQFATQPVIFLIRDPRLSIYSRIEKRALAHQNTNFPFIETGWDLMLQQIDYCKTHQKPFLILDAYDLRSQPELILKKLFLQQGLPFESKMLEWKSADNISLDNLGGAHTHLYLRVLASTRIEAATEEIPSLDSFPQETGMRQHVLECLSIYEKLRSDPSRVQ